MIDENRLNEIFLECLTGENLMFIEGVISDFGLDKSILEKHREEITEMLKELPDNFRETVGGGWSFLGACEDKNGNMWTSSHKSMEQLFVLGIGVGLVSLALPRKMNVLQPGGMPYYKIRI